MSLLDYIFLAIIVLLVLAFLRFLVFKKEKSGYKGDVTKENTVSRSEDFRRSNDKHIP